MAEGQNGPDLSQPPTEKILAMRNQKLSNNEIIQSLQKEGYNSNVILDGMNQADMKSNVEDGGTTKTDDPNSISNPMQQSSPNSQQSQNTQQSSPGQGSSEQPPQQPPQSAPPTGSQVPEDTASPDKLSMEPPKGNSSSQVPPPMENSGGAGSAYQGADQVTIERIEEIAEAIIDEKWNEIVKSINKIIDWKERTENHINKLEQRFEDLKKEFDNLNKGVLGKIGEYDKNLGNLGVEIKAMERVFQKIIPTMTENVHALQKLTERLEDSTKGNK